MVPWLKRRRAAFAACRAGVGLLRNSLGSRRKHHTQTDTVHRSFPTAVAQPHFADSLCTDCLRQQTAQPGISRFSAEPRSTCVAGTKPTSTCLPDRHLRQSCSTTTKPVSALTHLPPLRFPAIARASSVDAWGLKSPHEFSVRTGRSRGKGC